MTADLISTPAPHHPTRLTLCVTGSVAAHLLILTTLPGWIASREAPPRPLTVELLQREPPEIVPPQPLPMDARPPRAERPPPELARPVVKQAQEPREAILTAPPDAPPLPTAPAVAVVPEQRPPQQSTEALRQPPTPAAAPAPMTPPRFDAAYLNNPRPAYPLAARRRGDQGTVLIRVLVTVEGFAASVGLEKTSGFPSLDEAALTAVKYWRFVPARQGTQAIESPYVVPIVFKVE